MHRSVGGSGLAFLQRHVQQVREQGSPAAPRHPHARGGQEVSVLCRPAQLQNLAVLALPLRLLVRLPLRALHRRNLALPAPALRGRGGKRAADGDQEDQPRHPEWEEAGDAAGEGVLQLAPAHRRDRLRTVRRELNRAVILCVLMSSPKYQQMRRVSVSSLR